MCLFLKLEGDMSTRQRLEAVQARLVERGLVDIKVFFDSTAVTIPKSQVEDDVARTLEQYLDGNVSPLVFSDKPLM